MGTAGGLLHGSSDLELDDAGLWGAVLGHYRRALGDSASALRWLSHRGVSDAEVVETFGVGLCDRTLGLSIPAATRVAGRKIRGRLGDLGLVRESGHELFRGCVVVPVWGRDGGVVQCWGHRLNRPRRGPRTGDADPGEVLWLPAPAKAVWNCTSIGQSAELIVAESVLDGLVWASAGHRNVIAPGGPRGFPSELPQCLADAGVTRVLLAQERSIRGDAAVASLCGTLTALALECYRVVFPAGCDAASVAASAHDASAELAGRLRSAVWLGSGPPPLPQPARTTPIRKPQAGHREPGTGDLPAAPEAAGSGLPLMPAWPDCERPSADEPHEAPIVCLRPALGAGGGEVLLTLGGRVWKARGLDQSDGSACLKVNLLVRDPAGERFHLDTVDLLSGRSRASFVKTAALELGVGEDGLRRDLGRVLLACEDRAFDLQARKLQPRVAAQPMSATEEQAALELLRDPTLVERIAADIAAMGVVGEQDNALVAYLAATSRLLDTPLTVIVQSGAAAGKSTLLNAVMSLIPQEAVVRISATTPRSRLNLSESGLAHKVAYLTDVRGARASDALRALRVDCDLSVTLSNRNAAGSIFGVGADQVQRPVAVFLESTAAALDDDVASRAIVLEIDDGLSQTRAILAAQRQAQTVAGLIGNAQRGRLRLLHANAQRLLEAVPVVNPFALQLSFADGRTRARRDQAKYLTLIRTIALLHQHQRARKRVARDGIEIVYIEATAEDISIAQRLAPLVLNGPATTDLARQTRRLLCVLEQLVSELAQRDHCTREEARFTRREAREHSGWSDFALRRHLGRLVELEFVAAHRSPRGFTYELLWDHTRRPEDRPSGTGRMYEPDSDASSSAFRGTLEPSTRGGG